MSSKRRLSPDDWVYAGFRALATKGAVGVKAEPLARELGATKGSFYWHFKDVAALRDAMLKLWRQKGYVEIAAQVDKIEDPAERLRTLVTLAASADDPIYGGAAAEPALRAWGRNDPVVADVVARVDNARITYLTDLLVNSNLGAQAEAHALYALVVGLDDLPSLKIEEKKAAALAILDRILK